MCGGKTIKTIIAGSRHITNPAFVEEAINKAGFFISQVVSGHAPGVDTLGERWARLNKIPIQLFPAEWSNLKQEGAVIRKNKFGKLYNANAGFYRNQLMANYADALILVWDGVSTGSADMLERAQKKGLEIFVWKVKK